MQVSQPPARVQSDYEKFFLPFVVKPQMTCAPHNALLPLEPELARIEEDLDRVASNPATGASSPPPLAISLHQSRRSRHSEAMEEPLEPLALSYSVGELMDQLQGIDKDRKHSENNAPDHQSAALVALEAIPLRYLHFAEDVRPPYFGTFTKVHSPAEIRRLCRAPCKRRLPNTNYDYDSEAEWEEPEEGEELDGDDDDDDSTDSGDGDEDMAAFLDDEDATQAVARRRPINSDLTPLCSGLVWENELGRTQDQTSLDRDFSAFRLHWLLGKLHCQQQLLQAYALQTG